MPCYRGYSAAKIEENLDAEIFGLLLEEAREAFDEEIVVELESENTEQIDSNCARIATWVESWRKNRAKHGDSDDEDSS